MTDRRPLPLVTERGPVCQEACPCYGRRHGDPVCALLALYFDGTTRGSECLPSLREAWRREQERAKRTCGRCKHCEYDLPPGSPCPDRGAILGDDDYCSRFEVRS